MQFADVLAENRRDRFYCITVGKANLYLLLLTFNKNICPFCRFIDEVQCAPVSDIKICTVTGFNVSVYVRLGQAMKQWKLIY